MRLIAIVTLLTAAACSSSSPSGSTGTSGSPGGSSAASATGSGGSGQSTSAGTSGTPGGSGSGSGPTASGGSGTGSGSTATTTGGTTGDEPDAGPVATLFTLTLPGTDGGVSSFVDDVDAGQLWVTSIGRGAAPVSSVSVFDDTTLELIDTVASFPSSFGGYGPLALAHDLGKVFVATTVSPDGGCHGQIDSIDQTTFAVTPIAETEACNFVVADTPLSMTYDPVQQRLYASISRGGGGGYLYVIDGPTSQLVSTLTMPDAGWDSSACNFSSSTSCIGENGFGNVAVDEAGQRLFLLGADQNFYPMAASFDLEGSDGGSLENVMGGHGAGWETADGPFSLDDGGAVFVGLLDGGFGPSFLQVLDPASPPLPPGQTETAAAKGGCYIWAATIDAKCVVRVLFYGKSKLADGGVGSDMAWNEALTLPSSDSSLSQITKLTVGSNPFVVGLKHDGPYWKIDMVLQPAEGVCGPPESHGEPPSPQVYLTNLNVSYADQCP